VRSESGAAATSKRVCGCGGSSSVPNAECEEDEEALKYAAEAEEEGLRTCGSSAGDTDLKAQFLFLQFFLSKESWLSVKKKTKKKIMKFKKKSVAYVCPHTAVCLSSYWYFMCKKKK
jgi:hypothetical protein